MIDILNQLSNTPKKTEKLSILRSLNESDASLFKKVAVAALGTSHDFWVKTYPKADTFAGTMTLAQAIDECMRVLPSRIATGKAALAFLTELESKLTEGDAEVLRRVIKRDLKCGVSKSTISKVWENLIYVHPYMRCSSFSKASLAKIKKPCYSQTKEDGQYVDIISVDGVIKYMSRSGKECAFNHPQIDAKFSRHEDTVFMGEVLVLDENGEILPRTTGNGYLNKGDIDPNRLVFVLWDIVPHCDFKQGICHIKYVHRLNTLTHFVETAEESRIRLVDTKVCQSTKDIIEHAKSNMLKGKEGTVVKNFNGIWENGTSTDQVKCKVEFECDLVITGLKPAEKGSKYEGMLGAYECQSSDGLVKVNVGGGLSDEDRANASDVDIGKIITVKSNDLVQDRDDLTVWSLFLPRKVEIRVDKTEADCYKRILEQRDSFIQLLEVIQ